MLNVGSFRNLLELDISGTNCVTDAYIPPLIIGLTSLKVLKLCHTHVTWRTLRMLADNRGVFNLYPSLDCLFVEGCEDMSADDIEYARTRGIEAM